MVQFSQFSHVWFLCDPMDSSTPGRRNGMTIHITVVFLMILLFLPSIIYWHIEKNCWTKRILLYPQGCDFICHFNVAFSWISSKISYYELFVLQPFKTFFNIIVLFGGKKYAASLRDVHYLSVGFIHWFIS